MRVFDLSFRNVGAAPPIPTEGIQLDVRHEMRPVPDSEEEIKVLAVRGACALPRTALPRDPRELLSAIGIVAVSARDQHTVALNPVSAFAGMVFEDDVNQDGDRYTAVFRCDLDPSEAMADAYLIHAALHQHVSHVVWVDAP